MLRSITRLANGMVQERKLPPQPQRRRIVEHARLVLARSRALAAGLDRAGFLVPLPTETSMRHGQERGLAPNSPPNPPVNRPGTLWTLPT